MEFQRIPGFVKLGSVPLSSAIGRGPQMSQTSPMSHHPASFGDVRWVLSKVGPDLGVALVPRFFGGKKRATILEMSTTSMGCKKIHDAVPSCRRQPLQHLFELTITWAEGSTYIYKTGKYSTAHLCADVDPEKTQSINRPPASITNCPTGMSESNLVNPKPEPTCAQFRKASRNRFMHMYWVYGLHLVWSTPMLEHI